jgi:hypothetical protein
MFEFIILDSIKFILQVYYINVYLSTSGNKKPVTLISSRSGGYFRLCGKIFRVLPASMHTRMDNNHW